MAKRILVFPCGSEIGLEIHRSIQYSAHFELIGASSVDDHGRFVYEEYIGGVPFYNDTKFPMAIEEIIRGHQIDAIYPTMDEVSETIARLSSQLGFTVIGSSFEATSVCASKIETYEKLKHIIPVPIVYPCVASVPHFPVFIKPDRGYGTRNTLLATSSQEASAFLEKSNQSAFLITEHLPGDEWTIDCFSDRHGKLRFSAPRIRGRISHGISVYTKRCDEHAEEFLQWARCINETIHPRGAWFFQAKRDANGQPKLLEVAARLGGSSGLFRCQGINFALLTAFDAFGFDVEIMPNAYNIEMDRALDNRFRICLEYAHVFVDLDDCLIVKGRLNRQLISFLHKAIAEGKRLTLLTRHYRDPITTLREHRISELFDRVIHIDSRETKKSSFIDTKNAIFIDDSYTERHDVAIIHGISVFSPDMVEALL